jgi:serine/threonine protein kinase
MTTRRFVGILVVWGLFLPNCPNAVADQAYPLGCSGKPPSYYDYDNFSFPPPGIPLKATTDFQLLRRLGSGKFSDVFEAVDMDMERQVTNMLQRKDNGVVDHRTLVVLKCLKPVSDRKIRRELLVLSHCAHLPNLVQLCDPSRNTISLRSSHAIVNFATRRGRFAMAMSRSRH